MRRTSEPGQSIRERLRKHTRVMDLYIMALIPVAYIILFKYVPMYGAQIAFRQYQPIRGILGSEWVGLKYFVQFFSYHQFWGLLRNTLLISLYSLATFPLPILLAVLLNYVPSVRFRKFIQMVSYAPHFITTVVMAGILLQMLDIRGGPINLLLEAFGAERVNFMANPDYFYGTFVWGSVWQSVGYGSIIYISALSGVSPELHEAATIDGASLLGRIRYVDLPTIMPIVSIMLILKCGTLLSTGYEMILLLQNSLNLRASEVIDTYVYKTALASSLPQYSYSTAIGLFVSLANVLVLVTINSLGKRLVGASLW